jgi:hypothetical protein
MLNIGNKPNEPRPIGEVIQDLIREGMILPNYKSYKDGK